MHNDTCGYRASSVHSGSSSDVETAHEQVKDMKERAAYMSEFRCALKTALEEVRTLRTELAEEKSKSLQEISLRTSQAEGCRAAPDCRGISSQNVCTVAAQEINPSRISEVTTLSDIPEDTSLIILEASSRLDRIRDKVVQRNGLITDLRKNLQRSCSLLARREKKLEEKLLRENQLKTISVEAARDRDQLKALLERSAQELQDERELSRRKDEEIAILRRRLSATEEEARFLKEKLCRKDTELQHHRAQLLDQHNFLQRKCRECAQLRNQLDWINYKRDCQTWENENVLRAQEARLRNAGSPMSAGHNGMDRRRRPNFGPQNLRPRTWPEEQFYRREAAQTQRSAKPSFEQTLSPITEDGEEAKSARRNDAESNGKSAVLRDTTDAPDVVTSHLGNRQINQRQQFCLATLASPESNSLSAVSREPQRDGTNCGFEEYRTSQAEAQSKQSPSLDAQHPGTTQSLRLESKRETPVINGVSVNAGSISVPNYCKTSEGADCNKKTASLKEALENKRVIEMKMNEVSRAFVPSPSPTPSSVFSGGEDSQSEANTCNLSDSSCANSKQERRSKARKISKRKLSKHIRFRGHKIDVTDFTMQDFRELMWSACAEDGSADELLDFLASSAGRLEADARWQGKHSLGSPEDWLNLKGCY